MLMESILPLKDCQNCDFEEYYKHCLEGWCGQWRPDLDYRRKIEESDGR